MKRQFLTIAFAALAAAGCTTETEPDLLSRTLVVEATEAEAGLTRTSIRPSGSGYRMLWDGDEAVALFERNNAASSLARYNSVDVRTESDGARAIFTFSGMTPVGGASSYDYDILYPSSSVKNVSGRKVTVSIPSSQTPKADGADPAASLLYARGQESYDSQPYTFSVPFRHLAAYGCFTLKNLNLAKGESLSSIVITAEDENIAGNLTYDTSAGTVSYDTGSGQSITVDAGNLAVNASGFAVWFACKPFTLDAGKRLTVETRTSLGTTRTATFTATADVEFAAGNVTTLPVRPDDYPVTGKVWYVSVSGSDYRDGLSPSTAFRNFHKVLTKIHPGDQVRIMPGTYTYSYDAITLNPSHSGTEGNYISFVAHDPSDRPVIHAGGKGVWNAIKCHASYIVIDGLEIAGDCQTISQSAAYSCAQSYFKTGSIDWNQAAQYNTNGISIEKHSDAPAGPVHVIVRNCVIHDLPGGGVGAADSDYITFENNEIYNCAWFSMYANSGISIIHPYNSDGSTEHKIIIRGNMVSDCHTEVPWVRRDLSTPTFNMSDGNGIIIDINQTTGYTGRTLVQNNVSFFNGGSGIHSYKASHVDIVGNTAYWNGRKYNGSYGEIWAHQGSDVRIANNIMYGRPASENGKCNLGNGATYINNVYYQGTVTISGTGDLVADPMFVSPSSDRWSADFRLKAGSPAIGHGASLPYNPSRDQDGKIRGSSFDCGAYQYNE